jgi:hypothetical protein
MPRKILISFFVLIALLCAINFIPSNAWIKIDDFKSNRLKNSTWTLKQYDAGDKILTIMSTPVSIPHSRKLKLSGSPIIRKNRNDTLIRPLSINLYSGSELDSSGNNINITYQQDRDNFYADFKITGKQTGAILSISHYSPDSQIIGQLELYAIPNLLQNVVIFFNKVKISFYYILIFLTIGLLISLSAIIFSDFRIICLVFGILLIISGLIILFIPIDRFSGENIVENGWNKKTKGTNKLKLLTTKIKALTITLKPNKYYVISWQDRLVSTVNPESISWRLDLLGEGGKPDLKSQETERYFSSMKNNFSRNDFIINSYNFTLGFIRFMGPWGNGIEISNLSISEIPEYFVKLKESSIYFFIYGISLFLFYFKSRILIFYNLIKVIFSKRPFLIIFLIFLSYFIFGTLFLNKICENNGGNLDAGVIYRFFGAPILIAIILYLAGWPFVRWSLKNRQRRTTEILLSFPIGFLIILSTHSLSYLGIIPIYRIIILCAIILFAWIWQLYNKHFPALPNLPTGFAIIFAIFLFWIGIHPLLTQKDTCCFTITNNDISTYVPFVQWDMEHSMKEAYNLSMKHREPPYIGFMAWRMRHQPVTFGNYTAIAALATLTGLTAYQIYPLMSGVFLSLILLSALGSLIAAKLIKTKNIFPAVLCLVLNFIVIQLVWESFYSSMAGFITLFPITAMGTYAFLKKNYRFSLIVGLSLAGLLNSYPEYLYMVCAQLGLALIIIIIKEICTFNLKNILRIIGVGSSIFIFTFIFAPQQTVLFVKQAIHNPLSANSAANSIIKNNDGGTNYPKRSFFLVYGFLGNWSDSLSNKVFISPNVYRNVSFVLSFAFFLALLRLLIFRTKTWAALFLFSSAIPYGLMIAWAYFKIPNPYVYFKSLGFVAPFVSAAFLICWLDWFKLERQKLIKNILLLVMALWIIWRLAAVHAETYHLQPHIFIGKSVTSLEEIYDIVPEDAPIRINFTEWFNSAHIVTILRHRNLDIIKPFSYVPKAYQKSDYKYILENKVQKNKTNIWNNGTYYLYKRKTIK